MITLTTQECSALYDLIDQLSGSNPEYTFGENSCGAVSDPSDPACTGPAKLFIAAGHGSVVPKVLGGDGP